MAEILYVKVNIAMKEDQPSLLTEQEKFNRHDYSRQNMYLRYKSDYYLSC